MFNILGYIFNLINILLFNKNCGLIEFFNLNEMCPLYCLKFHLVI